MTMLKLTANGYQRIRGIPVYFEAREFNTMKDALTATLQIYLKERDRLQYEQEEEEWVRKNTATPDTKREIYLMDALAGVAERIIEMNRVLVVLAQAADQANKKQGAR